jgi:hypothetical protein
MVKVLTAGTRTNKAATTVTKTQAHLIWPTAHLPPPTHQAVQKTDHKLGLGCVLKTVRLRLE